VVVGCRFAQDGKSAGEEQRGRGKAKKNRSLATLVMTNQKRVGSSQECREAKKSRSLATLVMTNQNRWEKSSEERGQAKKNRSLATLAMTNQKRVGSSQECREAKKSRSLAALVMTNQKVSGEERSASEKRANTTAARPEGGFSSVGAPIATGRDICGCSSQARG